MRQRRLRLGLLKSKRSISPEKRVFLSSKVRVSPVDDSPVRPPSDNAKVSCSTSPLHSAIHHCGSSTRVSHSDPLVCTRTSPWPASSSRPPGHLVHGSNCFPCRKLSETNPVRYPVLTNLQDFPVHIKMRMQILSMPAGPSRLTPLRLPLQAHPHLALRLPFV